MTESETPLTDKQAIRKAAEEMGGTMGIRDVDVLVVADELEKVRVVDGKVDPVSLAEAMMAFRERRSVYFKSAKEMIPVVREAALAAIKKRNADRDARSRMAPPQKPGEPLRTAREFTPNEYRARLQEIRRRGN